MKRYLWILSVILLIAFTGCASTSIQSDPFAETERKIIKEGSQQCVDLRVDKLKSIDSIFAVRIPYLSLTNATVEQALDNLETVWKEEANVDTLPLIVKIDYVPSDEPPYEGYPGLRQSITFKVRDMEVAQLLVLIADLSPHRLKLVGNAPILECRHWIEEGWVYRLITVSSAGQKHLKITDVALEYDLKAQLKRYGVSFVDAAFYVRWLPEIGKMAMFNYPEEIDKVQTILMLIENGFEIIDSKSPQPAK